MKFWYTDNIISRTVAGAFRESGVEVDHVDNFTPQPSIFYGIHRGCGNAMHLCTYTNNDYYYLDNGYFDAEYVDRSGKKDLGGTYRLVKNGMHERYEGPSYEVLPGIRTALLIPPSHYSAYFHNTTPEDFVQQIGETFPKMEFTVRTKSSDIDIESEILRHDCIMSFNSMAVIKAVALGKPVLDTHGVFQAGLKKYRIEQVKEFYHDKQFTLEDIAGGKWIKSLSISDTIQEKK